MNASTSFYKTFFMTDKKLSCVWMNCIIHYEYTIILGYRFTDVITWIYYLLDNDRTTLFFYGSSLLYLDSIEFKGRKFKVNYKICTFPRKDKN